MSNPMRESIERLGFAVSDIPRIAVSCPGEGCSWSGYFSSDLDAMNAAGRHWYEVHGEESTETKERDQ